MSVSDAVANGSLYWEGSAPLEFHAFVAGLLSLLTFVAVLSNLLVILIYAKFVSLSSPSHLNIHPFLQTSAMGPGHSGCKALSIKNNNRKANITADAPS